ncbi:FTR1 family protein [Pokkaliibacter sp. MBI-7]|uniref:FTR1 family iron permease n=1 Tax=Pokkaliibacter sp. MBI-7 TaxID=3040600 RepID=UPI00244D0EEB|nr:FTR1 family protein [Pokkaliibacter sp. MBI-7]MDH2431482.1 FTR1 family protein [Pokkaliibacter sp. MBI-7]
MLASLLITLREGLEAFLLVGICLSYLDKLNARRFNRYIYAGVAVGLLTSLVVAFLFQVVVDQFNNEKYRNLLMAGILIFATLVLSSMALWMQKQGGKEAGQMKENVTQLVNGEKAFGLALLAFLAVMREGFETVLFFSALVYSGQGITLQSGLSGAVVGLLLALVLVWLLMRSTRKVPLRPFFRWSSLLILVIAAGLFSSSINMLQAAQWLPMVMSPLFDISFILDDRSVFGTFLRALFGYNSSPGLLQLLAWAGYLLVFGHFWRRQYAK